jgi:hypothetical protein
VTKPNRFEAFVVVHLGKEAAMIAKAIGLDFYEAFDGRITPVERHEFLL